MEPFGLQYHYQILQCRKEFWKSLELDIPPSYPYIANVLPILFDFYEYPIAKNINVKIIIIDFVKRVTQT